MVAGVVLVVTSLRLLRLTALIKGSSRSTYYALLSECDSETQWAYDTVFISITDILHLIAVCRIFYHAVTVGGSLTDTVPYPIVVYPYCTVEVRDLQRETYAVPLRFD